MLRSLVGEVGEVTGLSRILNLVEGTTDGYEALGVLLVLLLSGFHYVSLVGCIVLDGLQGCVELCLLCHSGGAETCQQHTHY